MTVAGEVPSLSTVEHLKRDIRSGNVTVHIDADIKVPEISGRVYSYTATYPFYDITELEKIFISGSSPLSTASPQQECVILSASLAGHPPLQAQAGVFCSSFFFPKLNNAIIISS